jgi:hypothetical protein
MELGLSCSWICLNMVNITKNEMESDKFKTEILTRLDRIENQNKKIVI